MPGRLPGRAPAGRPPVQQRRVGERRRPASARAGGPAASGARPRPRPRRASRFTCSAAVRVIIDPALRPVTVEERLHGVVAGSPQLSAGWAQRDRGRPPTSSMPRSRTAPPGQPSGRRPRPSMAAWTPAAGGELSSSWPPGSQLTEQPPGSAPAGGAQLRRSSRRTSAAGSASGRVCHSPSRPTRRGAMPLRAAVGASRGDSDRSRMCSRADSRVSWCTGHGMASPAPARPPERFTNPVGAVSGDRHAVLVSREGPTATPAVGHRAPRLWPPACGPEPIDALDADRDRTPMRHVLLMRRSWRLIPP